METSYLRHSKNYIRKETRFFTEKKLLWQEWESGFLYLPCRPTPQTEMLSPARAALIPGPSVKSPEYFPQELQSLFISTHRDDILTPGWATAGLPFQRALAVLSALLTGLGIPWLPILCGAFPALIHIQVRGSFHPKILVQFNKDSVSSRVTWNTFTRYDEASVPALRTVGTEPLPCFPQCTWHVAVSQE